MSDLKSANLYNMGLRGAALSRPDAGPQEVEGQYSGEFFKGYKSADLGEDLNYYLMKAAKAYDDGNIDEGKRLEGVAADIKRQMQNWSPRVQNLTDVNSVGDARDWLASSMGNIRSSAKPALAGLAGAAVGSLVGMPLAGAGIASSLAGYNVMADESAGNMMADKDVRKRVDSGEIDYGDVVSQARLSGALQAPLEGLGTAASMMPFVGSAKKVALKELTNALGRKLTAKEVSEFEAKELGKEIAEKGFKRYAAEKAALGGTGEFSTEFGQSLVGQAALNDLANNGKSLDFKQAFNEGAAGAVVGGGTGAITSLPASVLRDKTSGDLPASARAGGTTGGVAYRAFDALMGKLNNPTHTDPAFQRMTAPIDPSLGEADLLRSADERAAAASNLAERLFTSNADNVAEKEVAGKFKAGMQNTADPAARDALVAQFTQDLQAVDAKRWKTTLFKDGLEGFQAHTQRKGNEQGSSGAEADPLRTQIAHVLGKKYAQVYDAFGANFSQDPEARTSAQAMIDWVADGMPGNEDRIATFATQMWGKDAKSVLQDAYSFVVTEGVAERKDERFAEVAKAFDFHAQRGGPKAQERLRSFLRPTIQDAVGERDLAGLHSFLSQYAGGKEVKSEKLVREKLGQFFGANLDEVLNLYEPRQKEAAFDKGSSEKNEDGKMEQEAGDWNSGINESGGIRLEALLDTKDPNHKGELKNLRGRITGEGLRSQVLGAWDRLKLEYAGDHEGLAQAEDNLVLQFFAEDDAHREQVAKRLKNPEERGAMLRYVNKRYKAVDSVDPSLNDEVDLSDEEVERLGVKASKDPAKGGITLLREDGKKVQVSAGNIISLMREKLSQRDQGENGAADTYRMLMTGLSSLLNREGFTGVELSNDLFDPYTGMSLKEMREATQAKKSEVGSRQIIEQKIEELETKGKELGPDDPNKANKLLGFASKLREVLEKNDAKEVNATARSLRGMEMQNDAPKETAADTRIVQRNRGTEIRQVALTDRQNNPVVDDMGSVVTEEAKHQKVETLVFSEAPTETEEMGEKKEDLPEGDRGKGFDRDMVGQAVPERDNTPTAPSRKQIKYIKDLLAKGVPAFVAAVRKLTVDQQFKIRAALRELVKTGGLENDLLTRGKNALKLLRNPEKPEGIKTGVSEEAEEVGTAKNGKVDTSLSTATSTLSQPYELDQNNLRSATAAESREIGRRVSELAKSLGKRAGKQIDIDPVVVWDAHLASVKNRVKEWFGREVIFVRSDADFGGVFSSSVDPNAVFVNLNKVDKTSMALGITMHELLHSLRHNSPDVYNRLIDGVRWGLKNSSKFAKELKETYKKQGWKLPADKNKYTEELLAEIARSYATERSFWEAVANGAPTVPAYKQLLNTLLGLFRKLFNIADPKAKSGFERDYVANVTAVRAAFAQAFKEFAQNRNIELSSDQEASLMTLSQEIHDSLGKEGFAATHDSPIRHEGKFNWREHIGKGEGNASFGAGTYLSTADGVHRSYKNQFTAAVAEEIVDTDYINKRLEREKAQIDRLAVNGKVRFNDTFMEASNYADSSRKSDRIMSVEEAKGLIDQRIKENNFGSFKEDVSPTYHVTVNAKPEELLDWDAPLSEQSDLVKAAVEDTAVSIAEEQVRMKLRSGVERGNSDDAYYYYSKDSNGGLSIEKQSYHRGSARQAITMRQYAAEKIMPDLSGRYMYESLARSLGSQAAASDYLQSRGIVGHKYAAEAGTNDKFPNYVIYDDSRIETNYVHFNAQLATGTPLTEEQKTATRNEIVKLLGDKIRISFEKIAGKRKGDEWSGDWVEGAVRISLKALDPLATGRHEAMHQLMSWLRQAKMDGIEDVLKNVATNPLIQRQLARLLQGDKAALQQLKNPEEAAAYLYQFWKAGAIKLGPKSETLFQKAVALIRAWTGILTQEMRDARHAEQVMQAFDAGEFAGNNTKAMQSLENQIKAERAKYANNLWQKFLKNDALRNVAFTAGDVLRDMKVPALTHLADLLYTPEGAAMKRQSFFDAVPQQRGIWLNKLNNIFKEVEKEDAALILKHLQGRTELKKIHDEYLREKVKAVRTFLDEMYDYAISRGVSRFDAETGKWVLMKKIEFNYFPRVFDSEKILGDLQGFTQAILDNHATELARMAKEFSTAEKPVSPQDIAEAVVKKLVENKDPEINESSSQLGITPFAAAVNKRSLTWLKDDALKAWMSDDISDILTNYTMSMVKRAEYTSRFGNEGEIIQSHLDQAYAHLAFDGDKTRIDAAYDQLDALEKQYHEKKQAGIDLKFPTLRDAVDKLATDAEQAKALKAIRMPIKAVMAAEGTIGRDISEDFRKVSSGVMFYQNLRLLSLSLFSSLIDPLGIVVRGGTLQDAFDGFVRGIMEIKKQIKGDYSKDELQQLAERLGTVDAGSWLDALGQTYSSLYMTGKVKHLNDGLFKWNGMEAWNRAMRIQATQAAIGFIERHLSKPTAHSERYLAELGLDKDTKFSLDDPKVQQAVVRWVNGAILRPNAMQRPVMASDPHYALLYHLKQFTYSFHKTILQRAAVEAQHGNLTPAVSLVGLYVPMMIAADVIKELLAPGDEPAWMKAGLGSVVQHGVMRANLMGVPQIAVDNFYSPFKEEGVFGTVDRATGVFGPTAEQVFDWAMVPLTEKYSFGETAVRSLPHSPLASRLLL